MDDFLRKPFRQHEVFDCLSRNLRCATAVRMRGATDERRLGTGMGDRSSGRTPPGARDALLLLDGELISAAIEKIGDHDALIGAELKEMAERLAYTEMLGGITGSRATPA